MEILQLAEMIIKKQKEHINKIINGVRLTQNFERSSSDKFINM